VTIGQLLPDIENNNSYNDYLKYFDYLKYRKNIKIEKRNYPKNSFLEELNKRENINKIFDKVDNYTSYYSTVT